MKSLADGLECCVTATHLDGMVFARSAFHSSMNYRSVMVFGKARLVEDVEEKNRSFDVLVEHLMPGRLSELRSSTRKELNATHLLALAIDTFTTKIRTGPPDDPAADLDLPIWAGDVPYSFKVEEANTAPDMRFDIAPPSYLNSKP
jgi:nitroimidazol reductase NimA-like FMN-containing flavoprotein (pyridoxamine 5'-phosphate oxidase superfamily)